MALKNQLENLKRNNRMLVLLLLGSLGVVAYMAYGLVHLSDVRRIYIPPSFQAGLVLEGNEVPKATVFSFAITMWQQLHRWRRDGEKDYPANIDSLTNYLTPAFKARLYEDVKARKFGANGAVNELRGRVRTVSLPENFSFNADLVRRLDDGSWEVALVLDLTETFEGLAIKQVRIRYPLWIKRFEVDWERNPWGLAIAGFTGDGPSRLSDNDYSMVHR